MTNLKVVKVVNEDTTVIINGGVEAGIKLGDRFLIYSLGENIIDEDTKEDLGPLEIVKGIGRITHVQEKMATLENTSKIIVEERTTVYQLMGGRQEKKIERIPSLFLKSTCRRFVKKI